MTAISNRQPPVDVEYDKFGKRVRKSFANGWAGRAFYTLKLKAGKNPKVRKPKQTDYCVACRNLFPVRTMFERPPAYGLFCPDCAARNSVPNRVYSPPKVEYHCSWCDRNVTTKEWDHMNECCLECSLGPDCNITTSQETNTMNAETKERFVEACRKEWQRICFDILAVCPEDTMKAEEVQEVLADYITEKGWWKLTHAERAECLATAVPYDQSM